MRSKSSVAARGLRRSRAQEDPLAKSNHLRREREQGRVQKKKKKKKKILK